MPAYVSGSGSQIALPRGARPWKITGSVAKPDEKTSNDVEAHKLRVAVRSVTTSERTRGCGIRSVRSEGPAIEVTHAADGVRTRWLGTLTCGHRWTCPVCSRKLLAKRRVQIIDALAAGREAEPSRSWRMLTLTVRHSDAMGLAELLRGLRKAWRRTRQSGSVQRLWKLHVAASVRAVEITRGKNGWHPHLHVLILVDGWPTWEPSMLVETWQTMVARELGSDCTPDDEHGLRWSNDVDDRYLAKLGLEMTGAAKENSAWALAEAASALYAVARRLRDRDARMLAYAEGDQSRAIFQEYETATKGCRAIELDDRAARLARQGEAARLATDGVRVPDNDEMQHPAPAYEISMGGSVQSDAGPLSVMRALRILERDERNILHAVLCVAARAPPDPVAAELAVRAWLERRLAVRFPHGDSIGLDLPA